MRSLSFVLPFVALTFFSWGIYGPVLHVGQDAMQHSSLRPLTCVGVAYFLVAVVVPVLVLWTRGEAGRWTAGGSFWSLAAGAAGAFGALGIIMAFKYGGKPVYVMPLVFGLAPVVNTLVTMGMSKTYKEAGSIFYAGIAMAALGAAGVMFFKPGQAQANIQDLTVGQFTFVFLFVGLTAICWGIYGPVLHKGQMKMAGSRLRPFLCVGLAYFVIAVVVPLTLLSSSGEAGTWTTKGILWSLAGGAAGAFGALGIILAFNMGGKPIYVMPLVFGGAPIVNTFSTILSGGAPVAGLSVQFYASLLLAITGAVTVLVFAPKAHSPQGSPTGPQAPRGKEAAPSNAPGGSPAKLEAAKQQSAAES